MSYGNTADLSHWDFSQLFSGFEIASLVLGLDPLELNKFSEFSETDCRKVNLVLDRLREAYFMQLGILHVRLPMLEKLENIKDLMPNEDSSLISSQAMSFLGFEKSIEDACRRVYDENIFEFDKQKFYRVTIQKWINICGYSSKYTFYVDPLENKHESVKCVDWPWGGHNTALLQHLNAAAQRFWVNYDPTDATTAPTNSTVSEWLQTTRGISRTMADAIASILRADGLPTGPRK